MTTASVADRIQAALAEYLKRDSKTITPAHSLRDDLGLDSMATIELLFRIEEVFDLQIPDQDLQKLSTVGDVIAYVESRLQKMSGQTSRAGAPTAKKAASQKKAR